MAKHTLDIDLEFDSEMIGISCHLRDYRLCWTLNQLLCVNLIKDEEGLFTEQGNYALFTDECEETRTEIKLLVNQSEHGWFVPEHRQADYVLLLRDNTKWETEELLNLLRSHPQILTAYTIDPDRLKSKENLLLNDL